MAGLLLQTPRRAPILEQRQSRSPAPRQGPPLPRQSQSPAPMPGQPPPRQSQSRALATARALESRPLPHRPPQRGRLAGQMQAALAAQMPARRARRPRMQTAPPAAAARMVLHPLPAGTEPPLLRAGLQGRPPARPRPATPPAGLLRTAPQGRLPAAAARGIQARQKGRGPRLLRWSVVVEGRSRRADSRFNQNKSRSSRSSPKPNPAPCCCICSCWPPPHHRLRADIPDWGLPYIGQAVGTGGALWTVASRFFIEGWRSRTEQRELQA